MAQCAYCNASTDLYNNGTPVCIQCSETVTTKHKPEISVQQVRKILYSDVHAATQRAEKACEAFGAAMKHVPTGMGDPDAARRIQEVSRELAAARQAMLHANSRLNDFLVLGVVPEDLKPGNDS